MNSKTYKKICTTANYFLSKDKFWFLKYINFFNVLKHHPSEMSVYNKLINKKKDNKFQLDNSLFKKIKKYFTNIFNEISEKENVIDNKIYPKIVILSNINRDKKQYSVYKDFYYGSLAKFFKNDFLFVYRNYLPNRSNLLLEKFDNKKKILILNKKSNLLNEIRIILKSLYIFILCKKLYFQTKNSFKRKFLKEGSKYKTVASCIANLRLVYQIERVLKKTNPSIFIYTFEGHAWEKALCSHIKKKFPKIKIYGYQFSTIFKNHNIFDFYKNKDHIPHIILTKGKINYNKLINSPLNNFANIEIIGFNNKKFPLQKKYSFEKNVCLIAPELIRMEVSMMFNFSKKISLENQDIQFIFRKHPSNEINEYFTKKEIKNLPNNFSISKGTLEDDIKKSSFIMYRGSSVVLECVLKGLWPIYLDIEETNIDMMHKISKKNRVIKKISDFKKIVNFSRKNSFHFIKFYNHVARFNSKINDKNSIFLKT